MLAKLEKTTEKRHTNRHTICMDLEIFIDFNYLNTTKYFKRHRVISLLNLIFKKTYYEITLNSVLLNLKPCEYNMLHFC